MKNRILAAILIITIIFLLGGCNKVGINQLGLPETGETIAIMKTSMGDIYFRLFEKDAPEAVENFTVHAKSGYFDNLIFHRVIDEFMIQGGDPKGTGTGGESIWGAPFPDYFTGNLFHFKGALSMANSGSNTNGSQFFIVHAGPLSANPASESWLKAQEYDENVVNNYMEIGGTPWLDNGHTDPASGNEGHMVFGQVFKGMDVVDAIAKVPVNPSSAKPVDDVLIITIEITEFSGQ